MLLPSVIILLCLQAVTVVAVPDEEEVAPNQEEDQYYLGCYEDGPVRKLPKMMEQIGSVKECVMACRKAGYAYAGLQYSTYCFCGNEYNVSVQVTNCDMKCKNGIEICGGGFANSIYSTDKKFDKKYYLGCYKDVNNRTLPEVMGQIVSVEECVKACRKAGYPYAGVQFSTQCFCGNKYNDSAPVTNCVMKCTNGIDICGGDWANSIYSTDKQFDTDSNPLADQYYIGCFRDDKSRMLPKFVGRVRSVLDCIQKCRKAGYPYAGAQNTHQCFCGLQYDLSPRVTNCKNKCHIQVGFCGGSWANSIYSTVAPNEDKDQYYLGCYREGYDQKLRKSIGPVRSVKQCVKACRKAGYRYAGVQYSKYCSCGNEYKLSAQVTNCDMMCKNNMDICGGCWANSIYSTDKKFDR